ESRLGARREQDGMGHAARRPAPRWARRGRRHYRGIHSPTLVAPQPAGALVLGERRSAQTHPPADRVRRSRWRVGRVTPRGESPSPPFFTHHHPTKELITHV